MRVKMRGGCSACSAFALTVRPRIGSRFFCRMLTTSTDVQAQSAVSTASIGDGPASCPAEVSKKIVWRLCVFPANSVPCFHSADAIIFCLSFAALACLDAPWIHPAIGLPMMIFGRRLRVNQDAVHLRAALLEAVFEGCDDGMHAMHGQIIGQRAVA